jgi:hypothetical protein
VTRARRTNCTYHCSPCGRHFHSLNAFDAHHEHDETGWPICLDPLDLEDRDGKPRLVALTHDGACRMYADAEQYGVTVWTTADYKRMGAYFTPGPESCDESA